MKFHLQNIFCNGRNRFLLLLIMRQYFLAITFIAFDFVILSDLNCNRNNLVEVLFIKVFLVVCLICLNISLIALKIPVFFARFNCYQLTTKFLLCCFFSFYFVVNITVAHSIFLSFCCYLIVIENIIQYYTLKLILCLHIFSFK